MSNSVPNYPGAVEIEYVKHFNGVDTADITKLVVHIDIHSDIDLSSSFCEITIADFENYLEVGQIGPGDTVSFSLKHSDESYERRYKVKAIQDILNMENGMSYKLHLITDLEYQSLHTKISKSFVGQPSEIVKTLLTEYAKENESVIEPSSNNIQVICPMWSPIRFMKFLANKSRTEESSNRFFFFQDSKQFWHFTSLPYLRNLYPDGVIDYVYYGNEKTDSAVPDTGKIMKTIRNLTFTECLDIDQEIQLGNIKSTSFNVDFTRKRFDIYTNSYWDTFNAGALNKRMLWKEEEMGLGLVTRSVNVLNKDQFGGRSIPFDEVNERHTLTRGQEIDIAVYGNNFVDVGQIVNILIPKRKPDTSQEDDRIDKVWSGKYYVVAKRDSIDKSGHAMALRLVKDSFI